MFSSAKFQSDFRKGSKEIGWLVLPLLATNLGTHLVALVDVAALGGLGSEPMAAAGMANTALFFLMVTPMGLLLGIDPLVNQAIGRGELAAAKRIATRGIGLALGLTLPLAIAVLLVSEAFRHVGFESSFADASARYLQYRLPSVIPFLVLLPLRTWLQARGNVRPLVIGALLANLINTPLSFALTLGVSPVKTPILSRFLPDSAGLGLWGSSLAVLISTSAMCLVVGASVYADFRKVKTSASSQSTVEDYRRIFALGLPIAGHFLAECGSFSIVSFVVPRWFGPVEGAVHHVVLSVVGFTFQMALAFTFAATVAVGQRVGAGRNNDALFVARLTLFWGSLWMFAGGLFLALFPYDVVGWFSDEPAVIQMGATLVLVAAFFQVADGAQAIASGALRGAGLTREPFVANLGGYYLFGLPVGFLLAFGLGWRTFGLWMGLALGLLLCALYLVHAMRLIKDAVPQPSEHTEH